MFSKGKNPRSYPVVVGPSFTQTNNAAKFPVPTSRDKDSIRLEHSNIEQERRVFSLNDLSAQPPVDPVVGMIAQGPCSGGFAMNEVLLQNRQKVIHQPVYDQA